MDQAERERLWAQALRVGILTTAQYAEIWATRPPAGQGWLGGC
jgi:hypothetical protein